MTPYVLREPETESLPLLVSVPHTGTALPEGLAERLASDAVRGLPDTDWHVGRLYDFVPAMGGTLLCARFSRYVVDLNRPPDGTPLYPGRFETGLVPRTTFDGDPLYRPGEAPGPEEERERIETYYQPYHRLLRARLDALRDRFGYALLFEAHSIRRHVPKLVEGPVPDLVLGDAEGAACPPAIGRAVRRVHQESPFESAYNVPFRGGYITRHYGRPEARILALQLEMAQAIYMDEVPPFAFDPARAERLVPVLRATLEAYVRAAAEHFG